MSSMFEEVTTMSGRKFCSAEMMVQELEMALTKVKNQKALALEALNKAKTDYIAEEYAENVLKDLISRVSK